MERFFLEKHSDTIGISKKLPNKGGVILPYNIWDYAELDSDAKEHREEHLKTNSAIRIEKASASSVANASQKAKTEPYTINDDGTLTINSGSPREQYATPPQIPTYVPPARIYTRDYEYYDDDDVQDPSVISIMLWMLSLLLFGISLMALIFGLTGSDADSIGNEEEVVEFSFGELYTTQIGDVDADEAVARFMLSSSYSYSPMFAIERQQDDGEHQIDYVINQGEPIAYLAVSPTGDGEFSEVELHAADGELLCAICEQPNEDGLLPIRDGDTELLGYLRTSEGQVELLQEDFNSWATVADDDGQISLTSSRGSHIIWCGEDIGSGNLVLSPGVDGFDKVRRYNLSYMLLVLPFLD